MKTEVQQTDQPKMSADDQNDLRRLEKAVEKGQRTSIVALREIRQRKLFRQEFDTFDEYMQVRWNRTRQWATQQIAWLRQMELLEENAGGKFGNGPYQISVTEAQALRPLEPDSDDEDGDADQKAELFVDALIDAQNEANAKNVARSVAMTKKAVERRVAYINNRQAFDDDLTLEDSDQISRLKGESNKVISNLLEAARQGDKEGQSSSECLKELIDNRNQHRADSSDGSESQTFPKIVSNNAPEQEEEHSQQGETPVEVLEEELGANLLFELTFDGDLENGHDPKVQKIAGNELAGVLADIAWGFADGTYKDGAISFKLINSDS